MSKCFTEASAVDLCCNQFYNPKPIENIINNGQIIVKIDFPSVPLLFSQLQNSLIFDLNSNMIYFLPMMLDLDNFLLGRNFFFPTLIDISIDSFPLL